MEIGGLGGDGLRCGTTLLRSSGRGAGCDFVDLRCVLACDVEEVVLRDFDDVFDLERLGFVVLAMTTPRKII